MARHEPEEYAVEGTKQPDNSKKCELSCEVWSRVVGYYRPTGNWNRGKQEEFKKRKPFVVNAVAFPGGPEPHIETPR
ncbi:MAG TPA: anaerobic ribonucleoside-triphosphate reductase [bacterium]|nr:anaerobic ribonucleoside-triphosphate reductase [bacterium]